MVCLFLICLFLGSCHSQFDVSVSVLDPFYLNYYYSSDRPAIKLQLEFDVVYGDKRSKSYLFQTDFDDHNTHSNYAPSHFKFVKPDNIISPSFNGLVLDSPIPLPAVSPDDNLDIRFDINPVYKWSVGGIYEKCSSDERLHNQTVIPRSILHSETSHNVTSRFTIDLSRTPCLNSTETWFHNIKAQITIQVDFDCYGPCKDLFTTTTDPHNSNKLIIPLVIAVVVSGVEFVFIVGYCIHVRHGVKSNSQKRKKLQVEPAMYYDSTNENFAEYKATEEGREATAQRNQPRSL